MDLDEDFRVEQWQHGEIKKQSRRWKCVGIREDVGMGVGMGMWAGPMIENKKTKNKMTIEAK